jgi:hypothetical protein
MSTVTGTASFAQSNFSESERLYVQFGIGTINILVGILSTISQYLKISQLTESHRISSISWDKYARNIRIELAKAPEERMDAAHFMKLSRHEFDRLMETSPNIPENIVIQFKNKFNGEELFNKIVKPEICDILVPTNEYRNPWYNDENKQKAENEMAKTIQMKENKLSRKEEHQIVLLFICTKNNLNFDIFIIVSKPLIFMRKMK